MSAIRSGSCNAKINTSRYKFHLLYLKFKSENSAVSFFCTRATELLKRQRLHSSFVGTQNHGVFLIVYSFISVLYYRDSSLEFVRRYLDFIFVIVFINIVKL